MLAAVPWYQETWLWIFQIWQIPLIILLIALIIFYKKMKNRQV